MAQNYRRAIKDFKPHNVSDVARIMIQSFRGYYDAQDVKYRGQDATEYLRIILKERAFNDYSGNLSRSYYVKFTKNGASYVFTSRGVKPPVGDKTERGNYIYYLRTKRNQTGKWYRGRTYGGFGRHHRSTRFYKVNQHEYRYFRPDKEWGPGEMMYGKENRRGVYNRTESHVYDERFSGDNKRSNPRRNFSKRIGGKDVFIVRTIEIGNDTPYAPMVQESKEHPYNVLSPILMNQMKKDIEKKTMHMAKVSVRNMIYEFNKGYTGWFDKRKNPFAKK